MQEDPDFGAFYARWPRKIARADALKAWTQTRGARPPLLELLAAIDRLIAWRNHLAARREFVPCLPYPATWLRGMRWQDEFDAPAAAPTVNREVDAQWQLVRAAIQRDEPRSLTDPRTRFAIGQIGWPVLANMRADAVVMFAREFERHFNAAPPVHRAQVHLFPERRAAHG